MAILTFVKRDEEPNTLFTVRMPIEKVQALNAYQVCQFLRTCEPQLHRVDLSPTHEKECVGVLPLNLSKTYPCWFVTFFFCLGDAEDAIEYEVYQQPDVIMFRT